MKNKIYEKALKNAVASVEMEGYTLSEEQKDLSLKFLTGKINKEMFVKLVLKRCKR